MHNVDYTFKFMNIDIGICNVYYIFLSVDDIGELESIAIQ